MNNYEIQKIRDTAFCSGYNTAVSKYEKQNKELQEENAELKKRVDNLYNSDCWASEHLTKAKDIMKRLVDLSNSSRSLLGGTWHETVREAEDFLKENSTYGRIQKAKYNYTD